MDSERQVYQNGFFITESYFADPVGLFIQETLDIHNILGFMTDKSMIYLELCRTVNRGGQRQGNDIIFPYSGKQIRITPAHVSYVYNTLNDENALVDVWSTVNYRKLFNKFTGQHLNKKEFLVVCNKNIKKKNLGDPRMNSLADIMLKGMDGALSNFHDLSSNQWKQCLCLLSHRNTNWSNVLLNNVNLLIGKQNFKARSKDIKPNHYRFLSGLFAGCDFGLNYMPYEVVSLSECFSAETHKMKAGKQKGKAKAFPLSQNLLKLKAPKPTKSKKLAINVPSPSSSHEEQYIESSNDSKTTRSISPRTNISSSTSSSSSNPQKSLSPPAIEDSDQLSSSSIPITLTQANPLTRHSSPSRLTIALVYTRKRKTPTQKVYSRKGKCLLLLKLRRKQNKVFSHHKTHPSHCSNSR